MIYVDYKDLAKRTASGKGLYDKAFEITNNPQCDRYQKEFQKMMKELNRKPNKIWADRGS